MPDYDRNLAQLRADVYTLVLKKLDELVGNACRSEAQGLTPPDIEFVLAKDIWNFIKPWRREDVPRETNTVVTRG